MFSKETFSERRRVLIERMKASGENGIILFLGNVEVGMQYADNTYPFRQNSSFLYYYGIDLPRFAATIDLESGVQTIYSDDFDIDDIIWTGPQPSVSELAAGAGVSASAPYDKVCDAVACAQGSGRKVHTLPAYRYYNKQMLRNMQIPEPSLPLIRAVVSMRLVKSAEEIALIDEACVLGQQMHTLARCGVRPDRLEQEIVGRMEGFAAGCAWGQSFPIILTQHGEVFHNHSHQCVIQPGKLMVVDAGVEAGSHYASDFTRTYPTAGRFTQQQREIYQIVYECNELAFGLSRPGITYRDVHLAVARHMLEGLSALGLVHGDIEEMVAEGVAGLFMPHGLGHNMGLDVHDMEDLGENHVGYDDDQTRSSQLGLGNLRMARRLVPGNVVTDEPGIYFIPALIGKWKSEGKAAQYVNYDRLEAYFDFGGIRLEDDVLITADGARRLGGKRLPIAPEDVECAMGTDIKY